MKRFVYLAFAAIMICSLSLPAFAVGESGGEITEDDLTEEFLSENELIGVEVFSVAPITPEDTTGFKAVLLEFIGDYDPVIVEYEYQNSDNQYVSYLREVQPDYVWLVAAGMVTVFIYCLFRMGGALFCRNK